MHPSIQHVHCDGDPKPETIELINKLAQAAYNTPMKTPTEPTTTLPSDDEISENAKKYRVEDINDSITRVGGFIIGAKWMRSIATPIISQLQKENEELKERLISQLQDCLNLFPDEDDMGLYQRGLYDGYLNSIKIIVEQCNKDKQLNP